MVESLHPCILHPSTQFQMRSSIQSSWRGRALPQPGRPAWIHACKVFNTRIAAAGESYLAASNHLPRLGTFLKFLMTRSSSCSCSEEKVTTEATNPRKSSMTQLPVNTSIAWHYIICTYKRDNTCVRPVRKFVRSFFVTLHFKNHW